MRQRWVLLTVTQALFPQDRMVRRAVNLSCEIRAVCSTCSVNHLRGNKMRKARISELALMLVAALTLGACDGGGGEDNLGINGGLLNPSEYLGDWKSATICAKDTFSWTGGKYYYSGIFLNHTLNTAQWKMFLFTDANCTSKAGVISYTGRAQWSRGNVAGYANVARQAITWTGFTTSNDGNGTGVTLVGMPPSGVTEKFIYELKPDSICMSFGAVTTDSEGYPNSFPQQACFTR